MLNAPTQGEPITLDGLAKMIKQGFDEAEERTNNRFEALEKKFDKLERKVDRNHIELLGKLDNCVTKAQFQ